MTPFLNMRSTGSVGRIEQHMNDVGGDLQEIKSIVNDIAALQLSRGNHEGSILSSYNNDDKSAWREVRRELRHTHGFHDRDLREHKALIVEYIQELGSRGVLDDQDLENAESSLGDSTNSGIDSERNANILATVAPHARVDPDMDVTDDFTSETSDESESDEQSVTNRKSANAQEANPTGLTPKTTDIKPERTLGHNSIDKRRRKTDEQTKSAEAYIKMPEDMVDEDSPLRDFPDTQASGSTQTSVKGDIRPNIMPQDQYGNDINYVPRLSAKHAKLAPKAATQEPKSSADFNVATECQVPDSSKEFAALDDIRTAFEQEIEPQCLMFTKSAPSDKCARWLAYERLTGIVMTGVVTKLDDLPFKN